QISQDDGLPEQAERAAEKYKEKTESLIDCRSANGIVEAENEEDDSKSSIRPASLHQRAEGQPAGISPGLRRSQQGRCRGRSAPRRPHATTPLPPPRAGAACRARSLRCGRSRSGFLALVASYTNSPPQSCPLFSPPGHAATLSEACHDETNCRS